MSSSILHITNGDNTTQFLKSIGFKDKIITWREILCEGKTNTEVGSEQFWITRFHFLNKNFQVKKKSFIDLTLKEYRSLCRKSKKTDEIVLWFDYDLFCQINMLAVLSWIKRNRKDYHISLVTSRGKKGKCKNLGFYNLDKVQIQKQFKQRQTLSLDDIEFADYVWQLYCSDSPLRLENIYKYPKYNQNFPFLFEAIHAHIKRFPSVENGLNSVENFILETSDTDEPLPQSEFIEKLLSNQNIYGFGDLQYVHKIESLKNLFTSINPVKLSRKGRKVLENSLNFYQNIRNDNVYLGGAKKYSYLYTSTSDRLYKITS